jgi:hypothetical protein
MLNAAGSAIAESICVRPTCVMQRRNTKARRFALIEFDMIVGD